MQLKSKRIQSKYRFMQREFAVQKLAWQLMTAIIMCTSNTNYSIEIITMKPEEEKVEKMSMLPR